MALDCLIQSKHYTSSQYKTGVPVPTIQNAQAYITLHGWFVVNFLGSDLDQG